MNEIWANRLIAGTKTWDELPDSRKNSVKLILTERMKDGTISPQRCAKIIGENIVIEY